MFTKIKFIAITSMLLASSAFSQQQNQIAGTWTGTTVSPSTGNELLIEMKIQENSGSWRFNSVGSAKRARPCFGREFPITIKSLENSKIALQVDSDKSLAGCPAFTVIVQAKDNLLEGKFADGRPAKFTRQ